MTMDITEILQSFDHNLPESSLIRHENGMLDIVETTKMYYKYIKEVFPPTPLNRYDLIDIETGRNSAVKLENTSQLGDTTVRAFVGAIVGSALAHPAGASILSAEDRSLHLFLNSSNALSLLSIHEFAVVADMMGFKIVVHACFKETSALAIQRVVMCHMIGAEFVFHENEDYALEATEKVMEIPNSVVLRFDLVPFFALVGLATLGAEILEQNGQVRTVIVPDRRFSPAFSTVAALSIYFSQLPPDHPRVRVVPVSSSFETSGFDTSKKQKRLNSEMLWVVNHTSTLHATCVFEFLVTIKSPHLEDSVHGVIILEDILYFLKETLRAPEYVLKNVSRSTSLFGHSACFREKSAYFMKPTSEHLSSDLGITLHEFKTAITQELKEANLIVKSQFCRLTTKILTPVLVFYGMCEKTIEVSELAVAKAFIAAIEKTRTFGGKMGVLGLAALLSFPHEIVGASELACVVISGGSVNPTIMVDNIQWAQRNAGNLFRLVVSIPLETQFLIRTLAMIEECLCSAIAISKSETFRPAKNNHMTYSFTVQAPAKKQKDILLAKLEREREVVLLSPRIEQELREYVVKTPRVMTKPIPQSLVEFETDEHKFSLPCFDLREITPETCEAAERRLNKASLIFQTPIHYSQLYSRLCNCNVYLAFDNLQQTGSFKQRGSANAILRGIEESKVKPRTVVAVSAGNHSQGVSLCCRYLKIPCAIVCPEAAPASKLNATRMYGAEVIPEGNSFEAALGFGMKLCEERSGTFVHPFNDPGVIEGQSTVAVALHREIPDLDVVLVNVGGGGLTSGVCLYLRNLKDKVTSTGKRLRIIGMQAGNVAPLAGSQHRGGRRAYFPLEAQTTADGCNVKAPGGIHDWVLRSYVDEFVAVPDNLIAATLAHSFISTRTIIEGAGAIGLAGLLYGLVKVAPEDKVGVIICGGNIDINHFLQCAEYGVRAYGRSLTMKVTIPEASRKMRGVIRLAEASSLRVHDVTHIRVTTGMNAEYVKLKIRLSSPGFEAQNRFLIRLIKEMKVIPQIVGRDIIPHHEEVFGPFDRVKREFIASKAARHRVQETDFLTADAARAADVDEYIRVQHIRMFSAPPDRRE
eukprot:gnl/Chilomastix_cuspidata/461.p1 GENE.gnl/Chilomastix_cuspidata/461~~gnl/Chilomastix_cuspidata/461.p1  ORF type:complete len:1095 (-),score=341.78 gnl/Chilomastix_cuspidata/461:37-3321(-)